MGLARALRPALGLALAAALLVGLYRLGASAVWTVRQNEQGVVLRFGRVARTLPPGIHLTLPWPCERVERVATTELRTMPIGYRLVDRVQGRAPTAAESQWLTGDTNVVELEATLLYSIADPVRYLTATSELQDGRPRDFVLRKICEAVLTRSVAAMTIDEVLAGGKVALGRDAQREVQALCDELGLGLAVRGLNIAAIQPPAEVIAAFNDLTTARAEKARRITEAEGYRASSLPKARAAANTRLRAAETEAEARVARARGAADAFARLADEAAKEPALARRRLWLDALETILARAEVRVLPPPPEGERTRVYLER